MQIRPTMIVVPLLATILVCQVVQAIGEPSSDARVTEMTGSSRTQLAVLPAPVGHRQPTLDDLPPWLVRLKSGARRQAQRKTRNSDERPGDGPMTAFLKFANPADIVLARDSAAVLALACRSHGGERRIPLRRRHERSARAIGFAPACSREVRGSAGANVVSLGPPRW
jgi:hypothetical protein